MMLYNKTIVLCVYCILNYVFEGTPNCCIDKLGSPVMYVHTFLVVQIDIYFEHFLPV